ncbi:SCO family protein [Balneola sp. MJW-20]|uniref:SCO family protein n=1 Tax=Gracilimonas aurantiaca TaxID=3234185 RepID=UPI003466ED35
MKHLLYLTLITLLFLSCGPNVEVIDDFSDTSFTLMDADSNRVIFPNDFEGKYVVIGFIYTNCPDICPLITQNLVTIQKELNYPDDVEFVAASFDPERDTPSVLKKYAKPFGVDKNFTFLTGAPSNVETFLDSARVRTQVSMTTTTDDGRELYFLNHSDKIMVLDRKGRVVLEYGGSMTKSKFIIEDLNKIR